MPASGRNITFKIYNSDNQPFHNLVLQKATYDSVVMSLGDKITGDVYYKDTSLVCSMHEYIVYNGVQYTLVNPPTIVREGMVSDNSDLKGMTKYSFEFYHPMYMLNNLPFTDIAVSNDELRYKSQDKIFSWVGYLPDYIAKINKNLEGTQWVCEQGANIPQDTLSKISDVLAFSDNTIGDALKTEYETWGIPFVIDILSISDARYAQGKRYLIYFGQPANEIYESEEAKEAGTPFVFRFGQGVGLKNNSATPRNNKIITRLAGYGSERNVPFGYPQIVWDEDDDESDLQYPLYDGIVGGRWVKLIKHPFTRSHLMPTIYAETVARKVNPRADYYDPDTEIIDYHDALDGNIFPHTINPLAPSYEIHEFENIFPELGEKHIVSVQPINDDLTDADSWDDSIDDNGDYKQSYFKLTLPQLDFDIYACAAITQEMQINMRSGACVGCTFDVQVDWDDYKKNFYDEDNNFAPDGSQRDLTKYPKSNNGQITIICQKDLNTFGTIMPNIYQKPRGVENENEYDGDTFVILGISLPESYITNAQHRLDEVIDQYMLENNVYYYDYPLKFDEYFLATHTYILSQIKNNTIVRFEFQGNIIPLYVKQLTIKYGDSPLPQYNITLTDNIDVVINQIAQVSGDVSKMQSQLAWLQTNVGKNQGNGTDVTKLSRVNDDTANGIINFVQGLTAGNWLESSSGAAIHQNSNGNWVVEADYVNARKKIQANEVEILHSSHIGGRLIATPASMLVSRVEYINDYETTYQRTPWQGACYKCYFNTTDDDGNQIYNTFKQGDLAYCETFNLVTSSDGISHLRTGNHFYWRKVIETGSDYIILSNVIGEYAADSDYPFVGDHITLLGSQAQIEPAISPIDGQTPSYEQWETDTERQNAVIIAGAGAGNPFIRVYKGIDDFYLPQPDVQISPNGSWITVNDGNGNDVNITTLIENLQEQVDQAKEQDDGQIVLWFGDVQPTLENAPAEDWVTEQIRQEHIDDIYYDRVDGLAFTFNNDSNIPEEYTPIEYLEMGNNQYINTGIVQVSRDFEVRMRFQWNGSTASQFESILAYMASSGINPRSGFHKYTGKWMIGTNNTTTSSASVDKLVHDIYWTCDHVTQQEKLYLDDTLIASGSTTSQGIGTNTIPFMLGCRNRGTTTDNQAMVRIMSLNYKTFSDAAHAELQTEWDFVPVRVGQVGYMYDTVNNTLLGNAGNGSFTLGNDVTIERFGWKLLTDADVLRSLELAAQAQDTADGKRRVFVSRPTQAQAYDIGDLWVNVTYPTQYDSGITIDGVDYDSENPLYNNDVLRCAIAKVSGDNFSIHHWQPVQEYTTSKIEQTADRISLSVTSGLERTGIDITNGKIELNAANTVVSNTLSVARLETQPDTSVDASNKAKVQISGSTMNVFGATGIMNIQFGVDDEGYAVLKYYDNDGFLLYDLGPHGIRTLDISSEGFDYDDFYEVTQEGANDTSDTLVTLGRYHPKKIATVVSAGSIAGNNDEIAAEASGKWFKTTTYGAIISTIVDNGALDTSILANGTYRLTNEIFSMSDLELYGNNISDAKADLILQTGISQAQADAFDWELDASQPNFVLKRTIYWREYTTFVNGIEQPTHITVWQAEENSEH